MSRIGTVWHPFHELLIPLKVMGVMTGVPGRNEGNQCDLGRRKDRYGSSVEVVVVIFGRSVAMSGRFGVDRCRRLVVVAECEGRHFEFPSVMAAFARI